MAVRKIYQFHPILKTVCAEVKEFNEELLEIAQDMKDTLNSTKYGVGLAAPQIGITIRIILIRDEVIVNPVITEKLGTQLVKEGCLSYPGIEREIERPLKVVLEGKDVHGNSIVREYGGINAAIACHEVDHLDGICKVAEKPKRTSKTRSKKKKKKKSA